MAEYLVQYIGEWSGVGQEPAMVAGELDYRRAELGGEGYRCAVG